MDSSTPAAAAIAAAGSQTAANPSATALATVPPPPVRKFKAAELPLTTSKRTAIETLARDFKKKGGYDALRRKAWEEFMQSDYVKEAKELVLEIAQEEVDKNPGQLLTLERNKAVALIDGALDRRGIYQKAQEAIGKLIDTSAIEANIREIRRAEIGDEAAEEERLLGAKTDEEYAAETAARREERELVRENLRVIEENKRKLEREIKELEDMKRREEEKAAREARRKKEREE
ncbi:complex proteins associated with Set1p component shg1-domain-containing protein, partial [Cladorrhinum samala]